MLAAIFMDATNKQVTACPTFKVQAPECAVARRSVKQLPEIIRKVYVAPESLELDVACPTPKLSNLKGDDMLVFSLKHFAV